jgi:glycosyltransferase involved in cell wall biosynthesis
MHILFLSDNFPPEVNAPASRTFEHCREWVREGHRVTVITTAPNFPTGKVLPGYRNRLCARETVEGVEVIRVWSYISANEGFLRRTLDYVSYAATASLAALFVRKVDIVLATSPQFFTACAGWLTGLLKRRPYVFELRDLWPESIRAVGAMKNERALAALEALELFLYRRAAAVVSVTRSFKVNLVERGISAEKIEVITNGADLTRFAPRPKDADLVRTLGLEDHFVAGYVGTHGLAHALGTVLEAAEIVRGLPGGDAVRFVLLGDGAEKQTLKARAEALRLTNVVFVDTVTKDEVARYWSLLDASIVHLKDTPLFRTVIPSKLFECMAMGIPVLHGVRGESADIVARDGVGVVFTPENPRALAQAITALMNDEPGRKAMARRCVEGARAYDRTNLARRMSGLLERVVAK